MTYYRIWKYLVMRGLPVGQAHYVRGMIRQLVKREAQKLKGHQ